MGTRLSYTAATRDILTIVHVCVFDWLLRRVAGCVGPPADKAPRGHCRIGRYDLIRPSYHLRIHLSRQLFTEAVCRCRALLGDPPSSARCEMHGREFDCLHRNSAACPKADALMQIRSTDCTETPPTCIELASLPVSDSVGRAAQPDPRGGVPGQLFARGGGHVRQGRAEGHHPQGEAVRLHGARVPREGGHGAARIRQD
eukprot:2739246-Pyramimonas_sp.AAC.1